MKRTSHKPAPSSVWIRPGQSLTEACEQAQRRTHDRRSASLMVLAMCFVLGLAFAYALLMAQPAPALSKPAAAPKVEPARHPVPAGQFGRYAWRSLDSSDE